MAEFRQLRPISKNTQLKGTFLPSLNVKVFPCGWRGSVSNAAVNKQTKLFEHPISFNQEARLNTEYNFTHLANGIGSSDDKTYVINNGWPDSGKPLCFFIHGYYFEIKDVNFDTFKFTEESTSFAYNYAIIRTQQADLSVQDGTNGLHTEQTEVLTSFLSDAYALDVWEGHTSLGLNNTESNELLYLFTGLAFIDSKDINNLNLDKNYHVLQLFEEKNRSLSICSSSLLPEIKSGTAEGAVVINKGDAKATAKNATAFGKNTEASAENSVAFGAGTKATGSNQVVTGKYNEESTQDLFIVGSGTGTTSANRKDAFNVSADDIFVHGLALSDVFEGYNENDVSGRTNSKSKTKYTKYSNRVKKAKFAQYLAKSIPNQEDDKITEGNQNRPVYFKEGVPEEVSQIILTENKTLKAPSSPADPLTVLEYLYRTHIPNIRDNLRDTLQANIDTVGTNLSTLKSNHYDDIQELRDLIASSSGETNGNVTGLGTQLDNLVKATIKNYGPKDTNLNELADTPYKDIKDNGSLQNQINQLKTDTQTGVKSPTSTSLQGQINSLKTEIATLQGLTEGDTSTETGYIGIFEECSEADIDAIFN